MSTDKPSIEALQFDGVTGKEAKTQTLLRLNNLLDERNQAVSRAKSILGSNTVPGNIEELDPTGDVARLSKTIEQTKAQIGRIEAGLKLIIKSQNE